MWLVGALDRDGHCRAPDGNSKNQQGAPQLTQPAGQRQAQIPGGYRTPQTARYTTTDVAGQDVSRQS